MNVSKTWESVIFSFSLCPMPSALCPLPYALCSMPYALCLRRFLQADLGQGGDEICGPIVDVVAF